MIYWMFWVAIKFIYTPRRTWTKFTLVNVQSHDMRYMFGWLMSPWGNDGVWLIAAPDHIESELSTWELCAPLSVISRPTCFSSSLYAAADWWLSTVRPAPLWLFSEFGAVYKYSDLLTYLPGPRSYRIGPIEIHWHLETVRVLITQTHNQSPYHLAL